MTYRASRYQHCADSIFPSRMNKASRDDSPSLKERAGLVQGFPDAQGFRVELACAFVRPRTRR